MIVCAASSWQLIENDDTWFIRTAPSSFNELSGDEFQAIWLANIWLDATKTTLLTHFIIRGVSETEIIKYIHWNIPYFQISGE